MRLIKEIPLLNACMASVGCMAEGFRWIWKEQCILSNSPLINGMLLVNACMACVCMIAEGF
jgi:hypothetical protein